MVSLPDKVAIASGAPIGRAPKGSSSSACSVYKVPALLPDQPLPHNDFQAGSTLFLFFTLSPFSEHANKAKMQAMGFLPDGLFARILGTVKDTHTLSTKH